MKLATAQLRGTTLVGVVDAGDAIFTPFATPINICCVGKNYREHALDFARSGFEAGAVREAEIDAWPAVFNKPASCVVGPDAAVDLHANVNDSVDYEAELALIIGIDGRDIARADVFAHVFGYTIANDLSACSRQKNHKQWSLGKALRVTCAVNGEMRENASTADLIFTTPDLVATISQGLTLRPGDIISTGTPAGVGFTPPKFLRAGDEVRISTDGIGMLSNRFA